MPKKTTSKSKGTKRKLRSPTGGEADIFSDDTLPDLVPGKSVFKNKILKLKTQYIHIVRVILN